MLKIIKGDSKDIAVTLKNSTDEDVYQVYFSSSALNISQKGTYDSDEGTYDFSISKVTTAAFEIGSFTYDITVLLGSETNYKVVTVIHNAGGTVEEKTNAYTKE